MTAHNKHDFREETHLTAADYLLLKLLSVEMNLSKSAVLRRCLVEHKSGSRLQNSDTGLLQWIAGEMGLSQTDALSYCINVVGADLMRKKHDSDTGMITEK
jgi:hypothetical protein